MLCIFSPVRFIRTSSLSFSLSRFSIYVRLFGMLDIHILRSPQIYHNNPSISESEYRSTSVNIRTFAGVHRQGKGRQKLFRIKN